MYQLIGIDAFGGISIGQKC